MKYYLFPWDWGPQKTTRNCVSKRYFTYAFFSLWKDKKNILILKVVTEYEKQIRRFEKNKIFLLENVISKPLKYNSEPLSFFPLWKRSLFLYDLDNFITDKNSLIWNTLTKKKTYLHTNYLFLKITSGYINIGINTQKQWS